MSSETSSRLTENRKAHTVYLTEELWSSIDRSHLQLRLQNSEAPSKIEYIEQVLEAGLESLSAGVRARPRRAAGAQRTTSAADPPAPERKPPVAPEPVAPEATPLVTPAAPSPPRHQLTVERRPSALERLKQASDPGQPAPIRSVADTN